MFDTIVSSIIAPISIVLFIAIIVGVFVGTIYFGRLGRRMPFFRLFLKFLEYVGNVSVDQKLKGKSYE